MGPEHLSRSSHVKSTNGYSSWRAWEPLYLVQEFFFVLIYFLIGGKLLYNVVLVSAVQQHKSAIIICIPHPCWASLPSPNPTPLGHHRVPGWAPCVYRSFPKFLIRWHSSLFLIRKCLHLQGQGLCTPLISTSFAHACLLLKEF